MITAMQSAKLTACNKLQQAIQLVNECQSLICMGPDERAAMRDGAAEIGKVLEKVSPSNDAPPKEGL